MSADQLYALDTGTSGGATSPGGAAIIGDNPVPYASAYLGASGASDALATPSLATGEPGDFGGSNECAVEMWVYFYGGTPANTYMVYGPDTALGGNPRQWGMYFGSSGALQFHLYSGGSNVFSGGIIPPSGDSVFHHYIGTRVGNNLYFYFDGVLISGPIATSGSNIDGTRQATATSGSMVVQGNNSGAFLIDELTVYRTGISAARALAHFNAGKNMGWKAQNSGDRIRSVLSQVSSTAPVNIQTGQRNVIPRYMSGQAPIEEIRTAVAAEEVDAAFFVAADGTLTYLADLHRNAAPYSTFQAAFGDLPNQLGYVDVKLDYSRSFLINEWNVTAPAYQQWPSLTQTASDATSIGNFFENSLSLADCPTSGALGQIPSDAALTIAQRLLAKYKDPLQRVVGITFTTDDKDIAEAVLRRDLMDKVRIVRSPQGVDKTLNWLYPVDLISTVSIAGGGAVGGPQTIDGQDTSVGGPYRVLLTAQSTAANNGVFQTNTSSTWSRDSDADTGAELLGMVTQALEGAANARKAYQLTTGGPITPGVTSLSYSQYFGSTPIMQDVWIQKIDESGANDGVAWQISWVVSPV